MFSKCTRVQEIIVNEYTPNLNYRRIKHDHSTSADRNYVNSVSSITLQQQR